MDEWVAVRKGKWARDRGDGSQNKEVLSHQDKGTGAQIRKHLQIQMHVGTGTNIIMAPEAKKCGKIYFRMSGEETLGNLCRSLCPRGQGRHVGGLRGVP